VVAAPAAAMTIAATVASFDASFDEKPRLKKTVVTNPQFPGTRAWRLDWVKAMNSNKRSSNTSLANLLIQTKASRTVKESDQTGGLFSSGSSH
jgi:hypothetical protein